MYVVIISCFEDVSVFFPLIIMYVHTLERLCMSDGNK